MHVQYVCTAPHINRVQIYIFSSSLSRVVNGSRTQNKKQKTETIIFLSPHANSTDDATALSVIISSPSIILSCPPPPTFVPLMMDDRRGPPKWAHSDLSSPTNPQTAPFSTPWIFFPRPFGARSLSQLTASLVRGYPRMPTSACSQCTRHDRHRSFFLYPSVKFHLPPPLSSPVGIGATSPADSFNSDNYDHI